MGEFHRPKWSTVATAIGLLNVPAKEYLRKVHRLSRARVIEAADAGQSLYAPGPQRTA